MNFKTHLLRRVFFIFFEPFRVRLVSKFSKIGNMTSKHFFNQQKVSQNVEFNAISNPPKVIKKMHTKKLISSTNLTNMCKNGKSPYFPYVFVNNLFGWIF